METLKPTESVSIAFLRDKLGRVGLYREIFLILRENTGHFDGCWALPAGRPNIMAEKGSERLETTTEAAVREAYEEVGAILRPESIRHLATFEREAEEGGYMRLDTLVIARSWRGRLSNAEPEKCGGADWFRIDSMPEPLAPTAIRFLPELAKVRL